jgi:hypothetical protein
MMVLQNCKNLEEEVQGSFGETSCDADQAMNIKAEEISDAEEEEVDPVPISFLKIKAEPEVSCTSTVRQISQICRSASCPSAPPLFFCELETTTLC